MDDDFPYIEIPKGIEVFIGEKDEGTRIYRAEGPESHCEAWFNALSEAFGGMVSPGGVQMFAPVSRAAVYKRIKEGRLTAFYFYVTKEKRGIFLKKKSVRENPYIYVPSSEAKAWAEELEERMVRLGHVTEEELEEARPDWYGKFLNWRKRNRKK